jgi:hypothetical protein
MAGALVDGGRNGAEVVAFWQPTKLVIIATTGAKPHRHFTSTECGKPWSFSTVELSESRLPPLTVGQSSPVFRVRLPERGIHVASAWMFGNRACRIFVT